jgi:hypothetical protein
VEDPAVERMEDARAREARIGYDEPREALFDLGSELAVLLGRQKVLELVGEGAGGLRHC